MLSKIPNDGSPQFGLTGGCSVMHVAMMTGNPDIIEILLDYGCDPFDLDIAGNDALQFAVLFNRTDNFDFWMKILSDFDVNRRNNVFGAFTLSIACEYGPRRCYILKRLIELGAEIDNAYTPLGGSLLQHACKSEDADPLLIRYILKNASNLDVNDFDPSGKMFTNVNALDQLSRVGDPCVKLTRHVVSSATDSALHHAVRRGDVDVARVLLEVGANPLAKNVQGLTPMDYSDAYPELRSVLFERTKYHTTRVRVDSSESVYVGLCVQEKKYHKHITHTQI